MQKETEIDLCSTNTIIEHRFLGIKSIIIPEDKMNQLNRLIDWHKQKLSKMGIGSSSPNLPSTQIEQVKYNYWKEITKICHLCGAIAEYIVSYDVKGAQLIHRYCSKCLDEQKKKGNLEIYQK